MQIFTEAFFLLEAFSAFCPPPCNFDWTFIPQYFFHRHFVHAANDMSRYKMSKYEISIPVTFCRFLQRLFSARGIFSCYGYRASAVAITGCF